MNNNRYLRKLKKRDVACPPPDNFCRLSNGDSLWDRAHETYSLHLSQML